MKFHLKWISTCTVLFATQLSSAQLPELQHSLEEAVMTLADREDQSGVFVNPLDQVPDSIFIELGRLAYRSNDYYHAAQYFEIVEAKLTPADRLLFANALLQSGEVIRSEKAFKEYLNGRSDKYHHQLFQIRSKAGSFQRSDAIHGRAISVIPQEFGRIGLIRDNNAALAQLNCSGAVSVERSLDFHESSSDLGSFTKVSGNTYVFSSRNSDGHFSLKYAELNKKGTGWKEVRWLKTGKGAHNAAFPFYANGELYFASDRADGLGGFDLYRSKLRKGKLKHIENLGDPFNTASNEVYPIVNGQNLFFSSNGLPGSGSYDIYTVSFRDSVIKPLPAPWNSTDADWLILPLSESNQFVLRSTYKDMEFVRLSEATSNNSPTYSLSGQLRSGDTYPVGVRIQCGKVGAQSGTFTTSGNNGYFEFLLSDPGFYELFVDESNFKTYRETIELTEDGNKLIIDLKPQEPVVAVTEKTKSGSEKVSKPVTTVEQKPVIKEEERQDPPTKPVSSSPTAATNNTAADTRTPEQKTDVQENKKDSPIVHAETAKPSEPKSDPGEFRNQDNQYLAILGAAFNPNDARKLLSSLKKEYPEVAIYYFEDKSLYRAGIALSESKEDALRKFYEIKKDRAQVWLLKP
ncbi:MAG: hypothetical protein H6606_07065 [Flavobacteriales bacterium]|nr:hypothetical protein [Flavobacteriales bacterium]